jgi:hypothetical protein
MSIADLFWHLANLLLPALGMAVFMPLLARLVWWQATRGVPWARMAVASGVSSALALAGGLWWFGRDGRLATYGAMVLLSAAALGWVLFGPRRRQ